MKRFVEGLDRGQSTLFPETLEDFVEDDNPVRVIEAFVEALDLGDLGFGSVDPKATGRPAYHPSVLLKLYIYGYLNRVQSSRRLEREAGREFIGGRWIKFLLENKVLFAIRVTENSIVRLQDGRAYQLKSLLRRPAGFKLLQSRPARLEAMDQSLGSPLSFAAKRLGDGELLIVASNRPAKKALKAYRRRWQIECLFGDSKTRGLNMEDTRLTQPVKLNTLLVIITLAMAWAYACATAIMGTKSIKTRAHGYRTKSWFRLGFDQLRKWILHQPERAAEIWRRIWPKRKSTLKTARVV
jgi:hypothetical protein